MLGKLGKFLRILGFNTVIATPELSDTEILEECLANHRILLTKDKEFHKRMINGKYRDESSGIAIYIDEPDLVSQVSYFLNQLHIDLSHVDVNKPEQFIKRCSNCNGIVKEVQKSLIKNSITEGTYANHERFWQCTNASCKNIFWIGSHWTNIIKTIEEIKNNTK